MARCGAEQPVETTALWTRTTTDDVGRGEVRLVVPLELGTGCWHARLMNRGTWKAALVSLAIRLWAAVTPLMWRDLRNRTPDEVRGSKWIWWVASSNLSGSIAYLAVRSQGRSLIGSAWFASA